MYLKRKARQVRDSKFMVHDFKGLSFDETQGVTQIWHIKPPCPRKNCEINSTR